MKKSRKILTTVGVVVALLAGYILYTIARPLVLHTELDINATPAQVWKVLADRQTYPRWNPFIVSSTGDLTVGGTITNVLRDTKGSDITFTPKLLAVEPNQELRWIGRIGFGGIFDGEHSFRLEPLPGGGTRLIQEERFRGVAVPFTRSMLTNTIEPQFVAMNQAVAARATDS
jgi:hypothetical protein